MLEFFSLYPITTYVLFALFSLCVGSFLNVIIYRLPLMLYSDWGAQCREFLKLPEESGERINLFFPRSHCPECKKQVPSWHNIPVLSYLLLRGKCSSCKTPIPFRYFLVEILTMVLSLLAVWQFGFTLKLIFVLLFIWILIAICFIDLQHKLIPDSLSLSLLWIGLMANTAAMFTSLPIAVFSAVGAYLTLWLIIKVFYLITGKIGMGNGDFKLFAAFGAWLGWMQLPFILLLSSLLGSLVGIIYLKMIKKTKETPIPFGPFLCVSGLIALFWGKEILAWYLGFYR